MPIIAILPCIFQEGVVDYVPLGTVEIVDNSYVIEPGSWSERILVPLGITNTTGEGLWPATTRLMAHLFVNVGIPSSMPMVLAFWYFIYMFFVVIADLLIDVITILPTYIKKLFNV